MTDPTPDLPSAVAAALAAVREQGPLVQCLTNIVVAQWTANVLLAVGAAPAMVDNPREAGELARVAGGVLINLGTPYAETVQAMPLAAAGAAEAGRPWVLDPVGAGGMSWRTEVAGSLLAQSPTIVRGNASEILALAGGAGGRGVDATDAADAAAGPAQGLAREHATVLAVSGAVDHLTDGRRHVTVSNGDPLLTRVTGVGCALGAMTAAFAAVGDDPLLAATAATATMTVAAEQAARTADGPGSFAVALLDRLASITPDELRASARLELST
ncbi:hydroxyethylthiazole kinase [uncultured Jatrophihabitans sp.]|uniref:hydroxyethylthiazole kinase n=1 Tax=uncultured Jatrophihabitans sp. TaxID=1610747 RepID=UPI0035C9E514